MIIVKGSTIIINQCIIKISITIAGSSSLSTKASFKAGKHLLQQAESSSTCSGSALITLMRVMTDAHGGDDEAHGEADDDILQHRGSRGSAPIQVIITRRPRPKVTYVSLLQQNDQSQLQESKV